MSKSFRFTHGGEHVVIYLNERKFIDIANTKTGKVYSNHTATCHKMSAEEREQTKVNAAQANQAFQDESIRKVDLKIGVDRFGRRCLFYKDHPVVLIGEPKFRLAAMFVAAVQKRTIDFITQANSRADLVAQWARIRGLYGCNEQKSLIPAFGSKLSSTILAHLRIKVAEIETKEALHA